jgi:hypothetical protein
MIFKIHLNHYHCKTLNDLMRKELKHGATFNPYTADFTLVLSPDGMVSDSKMPSLRKDKETAISYIT